LATKAVEGAFRELEQGCQFFEGNPQLASQVVKLGIEAFFFDLNGLFGGRYRGSADGLLGGFHHCVIIS